MNIIEWRKNPERLSMALDMLNQPTMREMMGVLETEHPGRAFLPARDGFEATLQLGRIRGFQDALNMLRSFAEPIPTAQEDMPVTWGVEPDQNKPK